MNCFSSMLSQSREANMNYSSTSFLNQLENCYNRDSSIGYSPSKQTSPTGMKTINKPTTLVLAPSSSSPLAFQSPSVTSTSTPLIACDEELEKTMDVSTETAAAHSSKLLLSQLQLLNQQQNKIAPVNGPSPASDDKEERPSLSYKDLIIEAIESSSEKRLKLSEIYQVIRYLHPYYQKRADQWGWQNSIRHNLSLHDCFVKLPLKQTSASGIVGHFWTVVRDSEDKQNSNASSTSANPTRKRNRATANLGHGGRHAKISNTSKSNFPQAQNKGRGRHSVSTDSGVEVMSDESHSSSPTSLLNAVNMPQQMNLAMNSMVDAARNNLLMQRPAHVTSLLSAIMQQQQQSSTSASPEAISAFTKNKFLNDLLVNVNNVSATNSQNFCFPSTTSNNIPSEVAPLANNPLSAQPENTFNDLLLNLPNPLNMNGAATLPNNNFANEFQRLQLLHLYAFQHQQQQQQQQNLLQQILLNNANNSIINSGLNPEQLLFNQLQQNKLFEQQNAVPIPSLTQVLLSKFANCTTEQQQQHCSIEMLMQKEKMSPILSPTLRQETSIESNTPKMTDILEEFMLKNNLSSISTENSVDRTKASRDQSPVDSTTPTMLLV